MNDSHETEFVKLLTGHQTALRCFVMSMLPGCQDISDILQDTNVVLWEKMSSYEMGTNFRAWAFSVARNKVLQYRDQSIRTGRIVLSKSLLETIEESRVETRPEALEIKLKALAQCLDLLNQPERILIRNRYSKNEENPKASPPASGSARVALCRIRGKLRDCVEKRIHWKNLEA
ncbi:MAG: hypothetical protein RLZZ245_2528 [Verrucomicrobiota bacterium]|jgi:RNA polymerase sigma-70 factor (ECF subfamily)